MTDQEKIDGLRSALAPIVACDTYKWRYTPAYLRECISESQDTLKARGVWEFVVEGIEK